MRKGRKEGERRETGKGEGRKEEGKRRGRMGGKEITSCEQTDLYFHHHSN